MIDSLNIGNLKAFFFKTSVGNEPVREWLKKLPREDRMVIGTDIKTIQFGWPIGMPLVRHVGDGIWEIRSNLQQRKIARTLFFMHDNTIILVNGFIKKTRTTPKEELYLAKRRMYQFMYGEH